MSESNDNKLEAVEKMEFEACFQELESLVEQFERGQMSLSESVTRFERGMQLLKRCSRQLSDAEKKVAELLTRISPADMDPDTNSGAGEREE